MAIDQRDVSSTLRFMDDRALQQYAAMHKSDPYIFPLAFQESQNRQRLRMQQQGAQGMQPQPKVNEQALAQMAPPQAQPMPEDVGIGALPAGNMQFAAEGGIMGYDDANFVGRSEPVVMMAEGGVARYQVGGSIFDQMDQQKASELQQLNGQLAMIEPQLRAAADSGDQQAIQMYAQQAQGIRNQINAAREAAGNRIGAIEKLNAPSPVAPAGAAAAAKASPTSGQDNYSGMDRRIMSGSQQPSLPSISPPPTKAAPKGNTTRRDTPAAAPTAAVTDPSAKPDTGGLDTLMAEYERKQDLARGASRNADVQYASSLRGEGAKLVADEEKRIKDQIDPYKDREARLLKQEKGLEGMGDKYLGLALLEAGAAMMRTPGKFNFGKVVGAGIPVGSARYVQGIEKISAAKDKFADARDRLDDLRLNRSDMNARDIKAAKTEARTLERQAEALFYTGAKEDLKMTDKNLTTLLGLAADNLKTDKTLGADDKKTDKLIAGRLKEAGVLAAARGDTAGTRQDQVAIAALKAQASNIDERLKEYPAAIKSNAAKRKPLEDQLARINGQLAQLGGLGTMTPPPGAGSAGGASLKYNPATGKIE